MLCFVFSACDGDTTEAVVQGQPEQSPGQTSQQSPGTPQDSGADSAAESTSDSPVYAHHADPDLLPVFDPWEGDLPGMVERRMIRALVPWSDTYFYLDGPDQKGITYEALKIFEKWVNKQVDTGPVKLHVVILPVRRDQLLEFVEQGRGDIALGGITITEERLESIDFTDPISKPINELVVEAPNAQSLSGIDDLAGREVHIRKSSSYWQSLEALNNSFENRGLAPVGMTAVDEHLSTEDLMQMANADAVSYTIADSEVATFWANALVDVRVREDIVVRKGAYYGWAFRKDSPDLKSLLNRFVKEHRQGTLIANVIINRYLKDTSRLVSIKGDEQQERMQQVKQYFDQYAPEHDFDALMMLAQGFQESRLDQSRKSHRGAVGVMQLLPSTAADPAVGIDDISTAENNILAGIRYMAWIRNTYFDDPELDGFNQTALAFASYNAGPNRVRGLRRKAETRGLDRNVWFDNVELIAAEEIGRETVDYVANIYKYYVAFSLSQQLQEQRQ
jgi:membrane-bound lytic murein transglycosylase MltF